MSDEKPWAKHCFFDENRLCVEACKAFYVEIREYDNGQGQGVLEINRCRILEAMKSIIDAWNLYTKGVT